MGDDLKIIGFFCNWCTSTAADLAGTMRREYPPSVMPVRVMCTGSVDPVYLIGALTKGADGVWVGGCKPGECHYVNGNLKARRRFALVKRILDTFGVGSDRLFLTWIAASEGPKFSERAKEIDEKVSSMGKNPLSKTFTT